MITSKGNPLIKQARLLRQSKGRSTTGLFLIEGVQPVGAAIEADWEVESLIFAPERLASEFGLDLVSRFNGRVEEVSIPVMESIAGKDHPQGILAISRQRHLDLKGVSPEGGAIALVSPQDPGNVGTVLRTLEAVHGSPLFLLDGGADPFHPTSIRAGMGANFTIPIVQAGSQDFFAWRKAHGARLIGTSARGTTHYQDAKPDPPWILLMGSEQKGLSDEHKAACDVLVYLPMRGQVSSLNLAVAAGILLFEYAVAAEPSDSRSRGTDR